MDASAWVAVVTVAVLERFSEVRRRMKRVRGAHRSPQAVVLSYFQLHDRTLSTRPACIERSRNS